MQPCHRVLVVAAFVLATSVHLSIGPQAHGARKEARPEPETFGRFTVDQVERRLGQPNVFVFDGNSPETYVEHHLAGAVRLNHKDITPEVLPQDKGATLIFYCMNEL
ncbi:MAG TPA: rhodanese-like domain-containing protein [Candidatus Polarisedimenticolia bacterium]|nr:rhodanese-like domain-containing protein [Candidatus Polarisedimenticolia bacterium]